MSDMVGNGTVLENECAASVFVFHWGEAVSYTSYGGESMKRLLTSAAAAAMLVAGTGSGAQAQERGAPLFELGLYGGLAYTTNWFSVGDDGYRPGFDPIFGAEATFWATPSFGVRVHGAYFPSGLPSTGDDSIDEEGGDYPMNNYLADLDLVFKPWMNSTSRMMQSLYVFLGGGAMWTNVAGDPSNGADLYTCVDQYYADGVCLAEQPGYAAVGQGDIGVGWDWIALTPGIGIFSELAVHGYDSPAHVFNENTAEDKFAFTPRASLGLKFAVSRPAPAPIVLPPPPAPLPPPPPPPAPPATQAIQVCVVQNGMLQNVDATFNPATGDTTVTSTNQSFSMAYPATAPTYAASETWYINNDSISFNDRQYVRYGTTRILTPGTLSSAGTVNGIGVFSETGATSPFDVIYVPVRPGCEFQPYQARAQVRVRG
jgi:hypothetical protein